MVGADLGFGYQPRVPGRRRTVSVSFLSVAVWALFPDKYEGGNNGMSRAGAFLSTLCAFFLAEINDKIQIATIGLAARFGLAVPSAKPPPSKTLAAPSTSRFFQLEIWFGWTPNSLASSAIVRSPFIAASATLALNVALCFFRVRFMSCSAPPALSRGRAPP
jgi:hypothetical protein